MKKFKIKRLGIFFRISLVFLLLIISFLMLLKLQPALAFFDPSVKAECEDVLNNMPDSPEAAACRMQTEEAKKCVLAKDEMLISIAIPGLKSAYRPECKGYVFQGNFILYLQAIYKFFVGIAGILAVFMIMFGGVQWLFAGGSSSKITSAKETIFGSIIGLILVIGSYSILQFINPRLVDFEDFARQVGQVKVMQPKEWLNPDGSCKPADQLLCGVYCIPDKENSPSVIGQCKFCQSSPINSPGCGNNRQDNARPTSVDNCALTNCTDTDNACLYYSQPPVGQLSGQVMKPNCGRSAKVVYNNFAYDYTFNRRSGLGSTFTPLNCGWFINQMATFMSCSNRWYISWWDPLDHICRTIGWRWAGTHCDGDKHCLIDLSGGYTLTDNGAHMNEIAHVNYFVDVGYFNSAQCVD
jgi:hypothetical protein